MAQVDKHPFAPAWRGSSGQATFHWIWLLFSTGPSLAPIPATRGRRDFSLSPQPAQQHGGLRPMTVRMVL